ncbi:MAG: fucose isomerase, partial [Chloroflexi bacterium]|nr:fucose isomerase [Chloroflexota bacterium]
MRKSSQTVFLVASGDLRLSANTSCEAAQAAMEKQLGAALARAGAAVQRAHAYDPVKQHGFIDSQKRGIEVFRSIPATAPVVVAAAVWQYSHHVLPGLMTHRGPILTVANWSGEWPGLVGMLNLNASLTKAGVKYSTLWSEQFTDEFFQAGLNRWLRTGRVTHDTTHVRAYEEVRVPAGTARVGKELALALRRDKPILGVFDEGCMGMYNAIIPDELLNKVGVFKERLSQSALYARMLAVPDQEARAVYDWIVGRGMRFQFGSDEASELTPSQVLGQCKMYVAAIRIAGEFGCDAIGIQYQQGLKDLVPTSDLAEGMLNNVERPPVCDPVTGRELYAGEALPHFNEVDECAGLDALITNRVWRHLGLAPETTLHDVRWGRRIQHDAREDFVWVLEISGAVPPAHLAGGYADAVGERQPPMYFPLGGTTIKGICKPGVVVWSRVFVAGGRLNCDIGLGDSVALDHTIAEEHWRLTTPQWPIMHLVLRGITRDQFMARHKANHIQVVYAPDEAAGKKALYVKAAMMQELGIRVSF